MKLQEVIEIRDRLAREIINLPTGINLLRKGVQKAVHLLNNGAGDKISEVIGQEEFALRISKINTLEEIYRKGKAIIFEERCIPLIKKIIKTDKGDAFQDISEEIWNQAIDNYQPALGFFERYISAWVSRCYCHYFRNKHNEHLPMDEEVANKFMVQPCSEDDLYKKEILNLIEKLPEPQRRVIKMKYFQQLTHSEIAKRMKKNLSQVKRLEKTALANLKSLSLP